MKKVLIILNPRAGKMKSKGGLFTIVDKMCAAGWNVSVQTTQKQGHATELAADAKKSGFDLIVCCGGDGTLNEVIDGVMQSGSDIPLGYIPCGSTNDFAASMGISMDITKAIDNIIVNDPVSLDIGNFNGRHFSYIASFGAFTAASYSAPQSRKNALGHFAYILEGIKDIRSLKRYHMTVKTDDICEENDYIFGAVSNSTSVGGIVKLNSDLVDMKDGLFELILIKYPKNPAQLTRILTGILSSKFEKDVFTFTKTSRVEFDTEDEIHWTLDGEYEKGDNHIEVQNIHNAIFLKK
ncbi:MAG: diacylglycerol kinase family lipid kinase [Ruminococcaceae bacterium]|nr:diacylglycerol kinase family lipid kinase [Oscillospiraceae bacterium]